MNGSLRQASATLDAQRNVSSNFEEIFFFKQKTAHEIPKRDWSSDVCSSDLAYLDDAPLEERRTQAVMARRWLAPEQASDLGRLDPEAIARVRAEIWPDPAN